MNYKCNFWMFFKKNIIKRGITLFVVLAAIVFSTTLYFCVFNQADAQTATQDDSFQIIDAKPTTKYKVKNAVNNGSWGIVDKTWGSNHQVDEGTRWSISGATLTVGSESCTATAKDGYTFEKWNDYSETASGEITADITFTAYFKAATPVQYDVTLDPQGGEHGTTLVKAAYGSAMPSITVPSKSGYDFGGYYDGTNGAGTKYYNADGTSAKNWDKKIDSTLYAYWTAEVVYTITPAVEGDGGTVSPDEPFTVKNNTTYSVDGNKVWFYGEPTKTIEATASDGYEFSNWDLSINESNSTVIGDMTFTAVFKKIFTLTFEVVPPGAGEINQQSEPLTYKVPEGTTYGNQGNNKIVFNVPGKSKQQVTAQPVGKYKFINWVADPDLKGVVTGNITFKAYFQKYCLVGKVIWAYQNPDIPLAGAGVKFTSSDATPTVITTTTDSNGSYVLDEDKVSEGMSGEVVFTKEGYQSKSIIIDSISGLTDLGTVSMNKYAQVPEPVADLVYDGTPKTGVEADEGFVVTNNVKKDAGDYTATASLLDGYVWNDDSSINKEISWSISKAPSEITVSESSFLLKKDTESTFAYTFNGDGEVSLISNDDLIASASLDTTNNEGTINAVGKGATTVCLSALEGDNYFAPTSVTIIVEVYDIEYINLSGIVTYGFIPLPNATATFESVSTNNTETATTNYKGEFVFENLVKGIAGRVTVSKSGFSSKSINLDTEYMKEGHFDLDIDLNDYPGPWPPFPPGPWPPVPPDPPVPPVPPAPPVPPQPDPVPVPTPVPAPSVEGTAQTGDFLPVHLMAVFAVISLAGTTAFVGNKKRI